MIFPFGKYKHKHINYVFLYLKDYEYIDWYINNIKNHNIPNNVIIYLNSIDLTPYISGAAQPKLNQQNLNNIKIPNPSLSEKERIVNILDKFDTLTNSIKEGLPKEIELRQKQYEYYRDLLLTFPKKEEQ